eukprot:Rhum_TRINITY_DN7527_c0_g1::Rhum_TRINITY_DN7527_c0_g1_i1::g.23345::m.23345
MSSMPPPPPLPAAEVEALKEVKEERVSPPPPPSGEASAAAPAPGAPPAAAAAAQGDEDDEGWEEQDIVMVIEDYQGLPHVVAEGAEMQVVGLETDLPILRLGDKTFEGKWKEICGTGLVLDKEQRHVASCEKTIVFRRVLPLNLKKAQANQRLDPAIDTASLEVAQAARKAAEL